MAFVYLHNITMERIRILVRTGLNDQSGELLNTSTHRASHYLWWPDQNNMQRVEVTSYHRNLLQWLGFTSALWKMKSRARYCGRWKYRCIARPWFTFFYVKFHVTNHEGRFVHWQILHIHAIPKIWMTLDLLGFVWIQAVISIWWTLRRAIFWPYLCDVATTRCNRISLISIASIINNFLRLKNW